ncbi:MAG: hypothetical protein RLZZ436_2321 [Planctomycetota bacterium]
MAFGDWCAQGDVAVADVDGIHILHVPGPDQWEGLAILFEGHGVDGVEPMVRPCFGGSVDEPSLVKLVAGGFAGSGKVPALIPDFDPGVVAAVVGPEWCTDESRGDTDGAAGVDQQDGESCAGSESGFDTFEGALVGSAALCGVFHVDEWEHLLIEDCGSFGGGFAVLNQWGKLFDEACAPAVTSFTDAGVGQQGVVNDVFRDVLCPGAFAECLPCEATIFEEEIGGKRFQVAGRHVFDEEPHTGLFIGGRLFECFFELQAIAAGFTESLLEGCVVASGRDGQAGQAAKTDDCQKQWAMLHLGGSVEKGASGWSARRA